MEIELDAEIWNYKKSLLETLQKLVKVNFWGSTIATIAWIFTAEIRIPFTILYLFTTTTGVIGYLSWRKWRKQSK